MNDVAKSKYIKAKKLIKKINEADRYSFNKDTDLFQLDKTGKIMFIDDVLRIIDKEIKADE